MPRISASPGGLESQTPGTGERPACPRRPPARAARRCLTRAEPALSGCAETQNLAGARDTLTTLPGYLVPIENNLAAVARRRTALVPDSLMSPAARPPLAAAMNTVPMTDMTA